MAECAVKAPINANKKRARIRQNKIGYLARKNTVCGMTSSWGEDDILWIFFRRLMKKSKTGSAAFGNTLKKTPAQKTHFLKYRFFVQFKKWVVWSGG